VINQIYEPDETLKESDFDASKHGDDRINDFKKVMHEKKLGKGVGFLKTNIGQFGTKLMKEKGFALDDELKEIFVTVKTIAEAGE